MKTAAYRAGSSAVSAEAFYAVACDPQRSVVVEACAGAGKTWMLVSRILRALLAGAQPQQILAITFTRKAAGEMRERLDQWLQEFSAARSTPAQRLQALRDRGATADQAQALEPALAALHEQLLRAGRSVEVRTFHAWFAQLLSHAPLALLEKLQLPANYELLEEPSSLQGALFGRFYRAVQADTGLRHNFVTLVARHRRSTVQQWLMSAWFSAPEFLRADSAGHVENAVPSAAQLWPECAGLADPAALLQHAPLKGQLEDLARVLGGTGKKTAIKAADGLRDALMQADAATAFELAWAAVFTAKDEPRAVVGDGPSSMAVIEGLQQVAAMRLQQECFEDQRLMLSLTRVLLREYAALKRQQGLVDMADLERVAEELLGDGEMAGWVQERLDQRLRHVLIDEFQDTNPLQWQVLHGWLSAYAGAGGGASGQRPLQLFIVGDPKQSIYRFRGAEPRVFMAARDFVVEGLEGSLLQCDHTRRNAPEVIAALNAVFEDAASADGWGPYRAHTTGSDAVGQVRRLPGVVRPPKQAKTAVSDTWRDSLTEPRAQPELRLRAEEAAQVAAAVAELIAKHQLKPGEVMVLARKRSTLADVAAALAQQGIPHVVAEKLALHESPEALDLTAVLDVLASPGHDLSMARALKSPVFGASDHDLLMLSQATKGNGWCATLLRATEWPSPALQRAQALMRGWRDVADALPPHDLLDRIVHEGDVLARLAAAVPPARRVGALHAVHALLAAALSQKGGRFVSLYGFVRALRAGGVRAAAAAPAAAVQLLTVHGAKGLEARAVVVADADPEPRPVARAMLLVEWDVDDAAPRRVAFLRSESKVPQSLTALMAVKQADADREELNGLYVAMTRAREWLVFSRTEPFRAGAGRSWWARAQTQAQRWEVETAAAGSASGVAASWGSEAARVPVLPRLTWQALPVVEVPVADATAARLGQAVHRVLEWAGQPGLQSDVDLEAAAQAAATTFALGKEGPARVRQIVARILGSADCARFFRGPSLHWAGNEVPVAWHGEALRIDRLVALADRPGGPKTWWVLDYKLNGTPAELAEYRLQMQRYVDAVSALQPGESVRGAFITGGGELVEL
jgi:ATP-dependent helicase/nuclease subunit A